MASIPLFKGEVIRFTRVNSCGMPIEGPGNRVVTKAFVSVGLEAVLKDRNEVEQENANGEICFSDTTPPIRKRYTATLTMCDLNTCLASKIAGWSQYLGWDGEAIGFDDAAKVDSDYGMAVEVWTGGSSADDCPLPTNDDIFGNAAATARKRGYLLFFVKEVQISGISISSAVSNPVFTGITFPGYQWGKGVDNVQEIDNTGTAGRMLHPIPSSTDLNSHVRMFRTGIQPPEPQDDCCYLAVQSVYTPPTYYYYGDGASNGPSAIAPAQPACEPDLTEEVQQVAITGGPTGGSFTLTLDGQTTGAIAYNATAAQVQTALEALSNIDPGDVTVTGGPLPDTAVTVTFGGQYANTNVPQMTATSSLTGGTTPAVTVTTTQEGGELAA